MSDLKAKMHQIRFPLGLCPSGGAYSDPQDFRAGGQWGFLPIPKNPTLALDPSGLEDRSCLP